MAPLGRNVCQTAFPTVKITVIMLLVSVHKAVLMVGLVKCVILVR